MKKCQTQVSVFNRLESNDQIYTDYHLKPIKDKGILFFNYL